MPISTIIAIMSCSKNGVKMGKITLSEPLPPSQNPYHITLATQKSKNTRDSYARCLNNIAQIFDTDAETFPWHTLNIQMVLAIRSKLQDVYSANSTINLHLAALSKILHTAWLLNHIDSDLYARMKDSLKRLQIHKGKAGRLIAPVEIRKMVATCGTTYLDVRDRVIIEMLYLTGVRASELCSLKWADYQPDSGQLHIHGKGEKDRTLYMPSFLRNELIHLRSLQKPSVWVFTTVRMKPMKRQYLNEIINQRAMLAGVDAPTPHDFRRTFISNGFDNPQMDISTLKKIVGHSRADTTIGYDRRQYRKIQDVMEGLTIPDE